MNGHMMEELNGLGNIKLLIYAEMRAKMNDKIKIETLKLEIERERAHIESLERIVAEQQKKFNDFIAQLDEETRLEDGINEEIKNKLEKAVERHQVVHKFESYLQHQEFGTRCIKPSVDKFIKDSNRALAPVNKKRKEYVEKYEELQILKSDVDTLRDKSENLLAPTH